MLVRELRMLESCCFIRSSCGSLFHLFGQAASLLSLRSSCYVPWQSVSTPNPIPSSSGTSILILSFYLSLMGEEWLTRWLPSRLKNLTRRDPPWADPNRKALDGGHASLLSFWSLVPLELRIWDFQFESMARQRGGSFSIWLPGHFIACLVSSNHLPVKGKFLKNHLDGSPVVRAWDKEVCSLCGLRFEPCGCSYDGHWRLIWSLTSGPVWLVEMRASWPGHTR